MINSNKDITPKKFDLSSDLSQKIEELGFDRSPLETYKNKRSKIEVLNFERKVDASLPQLRLTVSKYPKGCFIVINSNPYKKDYHLDTGSLIPKEEVIPTIKKYLDNYI